MRNATIQISKVQIHKYYIPKTLFYVQKGLAKCNFAARCISICNDTLDSDPFVSSHHTVLIKWECWNVCSRCWLPRDQHWGNSWWKQSYFYDDSCGVTIGCIAVVCVAYVVAPLSLTGVGHERILLVAFSYDYSALRVLLIKNRKQRNI